MNFLFVFMVISCVIVTAKGARILALIPFQAKSHYFVYEPLLKRLAEKGHDVVSVTHFPQKVPLSNFTDVDVSSSLPSLDGTMSLDGFTVKPGIEMLPEFFKHCGIMICDPLFQNSKLQKIINSKEKFDVFIVEMFATDCFLGIAHKMQIPIVVSVITCVALPWSYGVIGNPETPSYIPNLFSSFTDRMDIFQRVENSWNFLYTKVLHKYFSDQPSYQIAKKYLGEDLPDFDSLRSNISLILTNGHPTVSTPRVQAPAFKELGGMHIPASGPKPLPKNLKDYLDGQGKDGVVYFSLGSLLNSTTMPARVLAAFYKAFEQLPQQILWKCSKEKMPTLPKNVKCIEWAPQLSILCHPNVRLFITHGGLLGTQEAVYCGVPILGMPLFGDHHLNMAYFVKKGLALQLNYGELSYEAISSALNELLTNKSYAEVARKTSLQFKDRLIHPTEEAVYWIEYLLRHGPNSLKTEVVNLAWYQYLLLDVICIAIIVILITIWIAYKLFKLLRNYSRKVYTSMNVHKKFD
ncbi:UDP-glycosyltransferase UGT5 [Nomia melanderi]|uniref:UDP-glycosyltransferase UGT5 n=1 Tax=Nomia melanderi TaxID=2448451 RepID=UPI003FCC346E